MPAFGVIQRRNNKTAILAGQYETAYYNHVIGLGGTVIDRQYVFDKYRYFIENDLMRDLEHYSSPRAGVLLSSNAVTNLLQSSHRFNNAPWTKASVTVSDNTETAPDGTLTASKIVGGNGVATSLTQLLQGHTKAASATTYTASIYVKSAGFNRIRLETYNAGFTGSANAVVNLTDGTVSSSAAAGTFSGAVARVTPELNSYYRVHLTFTSDASTNVTFYVFPQDTVAASGNGVDGIAIWHPQLQTGSIATDYIDTRNLINNSNVPFNDGRVVADTLSGVNLYTATVNGFTEAYYSWAPPGNSGLFSIVNTYVYTFSFYAKRGTGSSFTAELVDSGGTLRSGTVGFTIPVGGERVSIVLTANATTSAQIRIKGTIGQTMLFGGVQIELGSTASDYLATTTTASSTQSQSFYQRGFDMSHPLERNLFTHSENLSSTTWAKGDVTVTPYYTTLPTTVPHAWEMKETATTAHHYVRFNGATATLETASRYTFSAKVKKNNVQYISLVHNGSSTYGATFDFDSGAFVTLGASITNTSVTALNDGWFRISVTMLPNGTATNFDLYMCNSTAVRTSYAGNVNNSVYVTAMQLQIGATVTTYTPTQRNLLLKSEEYNNALWTKTDMTITDRVIADSNGRLSGSLFTQGVGSSSIYQDVVANSAYVSFSTEFKVGTVGEWILLRLTSVGGGVIAGKYFNINTGELGTDYTTGGGLIISSAISSKGNGWYKVSITCDLPEATYRAIFYASVSDNNVARQPNATFYVTKSQAEFGPVSSDYMRTNIVENAHPKDLIQTATTSQPYWGIDAETGFRVPMYDGINDTMTVANRLTLNAVHEATGIAVYKDFNRLGGASSHQVMEVLGSAETRVGFRNVTGSGGQVRFDTNRIVAGVETATNLQSISSLTTLSFISHMVSWLTGFHSFYHNGSRVNSAIVTSQYQNNTNSLADIRVGSFHGGGSPGGYLNGIIGDVLVFRNYMTTAQLDELKRRMKTTYITLP